MGRPQIFPDMQHINTSHVIRRISFGPDFPGACVSASAKRVASPTHAHIGAVNPLDGVVRRAEGKEVKGTYKYFLKACP